MACLCCLMAQILNIPISWRKTEFGPRVQWIGWQFHITAAWTSKKSLEKLVELLNWVTQIFSLMRCWLPVLYKDLYHIPASHYSIDPGHQAVQCKAGLHQLYLSERRTWLRLRDPKSIRRILSADSHRILTMYFSWIQSVSLVKCLRPKPLWSGECAADAMASKDICQIGGFIRFPSGTQIWFSEKLLSKIFQSEYSSDS